MRRHGAEDPPAHPRRPGERHLSWKRRAASAVTTSAVIVGLGTLAYGSTHTYLGFISDPPKHESAPGTPPAPTPTPPPSVDTHRPASPAPKRVTGGDRDAVRPSRPEPPSTPRATPTRTPAPERSATPLPSTRPSLVTFDYETQRTEDGFRGNVTIRNASDRPLEDWRLVLGFSDARVRSVLDSLGAPTLDGLVAGGLLGPPRIAPGESLTVSFTAVGDSSGRVSCRFNDDPCVLY